MWTRPLGDALTDIAGSLLDMNAHELPLVRATRVELSFPVEVRLRRRQNDLVFCADVPAWRWQTDWDLPFGQLRLTLEDTARESGE